MTAPDLEALIARAIASVPAARAPEAVLAAIRETHDLIPKADHRRGDNAPYLRVTTKDGTRLQGTMRWSAGGAVIDFNELVTLDSLMIEHIP